jgi:hypothetical protein
MGHHWIQRRDKGVLLLCCRLVILASIIDCLGKLVDETHTLYDYRILRIV